MFSLFRKKTKRLFEVSNAICACVRMLLVYRIKNDNFYRAQLQVGGIDPGDEDFEKDLDMLSPEQLSSSEEYYIIYLIVLFITLERKAGERFSYQDIVYTIDQQLPKPQGYVPVEKWAPENYAKYIKFRLAIDCPDAHYPNFAVDDLYEKAYSYLSDNFDYDGPFSF